MSALLLSLLPRSDGGAAPPTEDQPAVPVIFHVTGFGPFQGVEDNPSSQIVRDLEAYVGEGDGAGKLADNVSIGSTTVVETSGPGAQLALTMLGSGLNPDGSADSNEIHVLLHLGVHGGTDRFRLERYAHNNASFRCPDESGWQPTNLPICADDGEVTVDRACPLPIDDCVAALTEQGFLCTGSDSPGLFVCNYIYYLSLRMTAASEDGGDPEGNATGEPRADTSPISVFVHVPPFAAIGKNDQLAFVTAAINTFAAAARTLSAKQ